MILAKVKPVEFSGRRPRLGKPSSLGRLRRQVSIIGPERTFRRAIASDYRTFGRDLLAELRESGVFERLAEDAARYMDSQDATRRREGAKQEDPTPIGRGGVPLSPGHQRELRRIFSRGAIGFAADLVEDPIDAFRLSFASTLDENYHDLFDVGGRAARLSLGVSGSFNLRSSAIAEALDQRANLLSGSIADDVFDRMITVIAQEFYLEGKGPLEVARSLEGEFDWLERDRAERIARTETLGVTEEAQWQTYAASGVEWKRWMTTLDGRERETHFDAHGQIKALDEPFEVGADELMFPGDPEGSPGEICNCRCASQAIVHESQVFNDRAVWDGENDPDEFSRERVQERRDQEFNERLGEFEGEKRAPILRRFFGSWFKQERDYVRDDAGRFAETEGGGGGAEAEDVALAARLAENRRYHEATKERVEQMQDAAGEALDRILESEGITPAQQDALGAMAQAAVEGDWNLTDRRLMEADAAFGGSSAARFHLDKVATPISEQQADDIRRWLPQERTTTGTFTTDPRGIAKARELEQQISGRVREQGFFVSPAGEILYDSGPDAGNYGEVPTGPFSASQVGGIMVHNHPNSNTLSLGDVKVAQQRQLAEIRAVGYNGNRFRMSLPEDPPAERMAGIERETDPVVRESLRARNRAAWLDRSNAWTMVQGVHEQESEAVRLDHRARVKSGEMLPHEAVNRYHHEVWQRIAKRGYINYEYDPNP